MLICIEGVDSAGKATQSKLLAQRLRGQLFSFPRYNTPIGQAILRHLKGEVQLHEVRHILHRGGKTGETQTRIALEDPLAFQCLMIADKLAAAHEIDVASKTRAAVCDRWIPSAICYGAADGLDFDMLVQMHDFLPQADLNIFLDVPPEEALRRRPEARDRYERDRAKQETVRENYKKLWSTGGPRYVTVDGMAPGDLGTDDAIEVVFDRVWDAILKMWHLGLRGKR